MKRFARNGFTIVEMLVVMAVIAVLAGIVTTAANSAIKRSRGRRADAMLQTLQAGLATYNSQNGCWPKGTALEAYADGDRQMTGDTVMLEDVEVDAVFQAIVKASLESTGNPYLDVSGLFVGKAGVEGCHDAHQHHTSVNGGSLDTDYKYCADKKCAFGYEFMEVYRGKGKIKKMDPGSMAFGYPGPNTSRFCRFRIRYNGKTDTVTVLKQPIDEAGVYE